MTTHTNFFAILSQDQLASLIAEIKETLAVNSVQKNNKMLSAADVWNIQRRKRHFVQRRASL